jgi:uncharacterized protein YndB with AHSA1/START domain
LIIAPREAVFEAFMDPDALAAWQAPEGMTGRVHSFDGRVGGGYEMSPYYPPSEETFRGRTAPREDRFTARYVELLPPSRIVQAITFRSDDAGFAGEMIMTVTLDPEAGGTRVTFDFTDIPPGIRLEDNEAGTESALANLARYLEKTA